MFFPYFPHFFSDFSAHLPGDDQPKFEKLRKLCRAAVTGRLGGDPMLAIFSLAEP